MTGSKVLKTLLLSAMLAGCVTQPASNDSAAAGNSNASSGTEAGSESGAQVFESVSLTRTACFGKCPVYTVSLTADGEVSYRGERNVRVTGVATGQADPVVLQELKTFLRENKLPKISVYEPGKPGCEYAATDMASARITIQGDGHAHKLQYYEGCRSVPEKLTQLAELIDRATLSGRWVGGAHAPEILRAPQQ